jgi:hypothetical protein
MKVRATKDTRKMQAQIMDELGDKIMASHTKTGYFFGALNSVMRQTAENELDLDLFERICEAFQSAANYKG